MQRAHTTSISLWPKTRWLWLPGSCSSRSGQRSTGRGSTSACPMRRWPRTSPLLLVSLAFRCHKALQHDNNVSLRPASHAHRLLQGIGVPLIPCSVVFARDSSCAGALQERTEGAVAYGTAEMSMPCNHVHCLCRPFCCCGGHARTVSCRGCGSWRRRC